MAYLFRINKTDGNAKATIVSWSNTTNCTYNQGFVSSIQDSTTHQNEITSIPSPFARIELVKEAYAKVVGGPINNRSQKKVEDQLHGKTIYHKMVSDALDVAQIFYNYPSLQDKVQIMVWDPLVHIQQLQNSNVESHKILARTLNMFLQQDALGTDPYNFGKMQNIYILRYIGPDQRPMHIIGATSPATLFFSTANDESAISQQLCFGNDYAFDSDYKSLDQRDPDFIKYLFTLRYSDPQFATNYPEVNAYLNAVYFVLSNQMKQDINQIQTSCQNIVPGTVSYINATYKPLNVDVSSTSQMQVEVNGMFLHVKTFNAVGKSDFEIVSGKVAQGVNLPLVLPVIKSNVYEKMQYFGCPFGRNFTIPNYDPTSPQQRHLPGINQPYPYLTISDFLEDKIVKLPTEVNKDYFDGNYHSSTGRIEGYLLPVKPIYFDYFEAADLMGNTPSGNKTIEIKTVASGVEVTLRIPVKGGDVEYKRIYTLDVQADQKNNTGAIVVADEDSAIGVFPPVKFSNVKEAHYRIALVSDFVLNQKMSIECHNNAKGFFVPNYVVRNVNVQDEARSKVYILAGEEFDCVRVDVLTNVPGRERRATGILLPMFKGNIGGTNMSFAIDFGTSNTHIEYSMGVNSMPQPFSVNSNDQQISLVYKTSDDTLDHIRGELIPEVIGKDSLCAFPMRTVLGIDKNNSGINEKGAGPHIAFGNASPAFMYNKKEIGTKYNEYVPNLKWSNMNATNVGRINCYIESLFLMIRNKVLQNGGNLSQTQIRWFYPISMSNNKRGLFQNLWDNAYKKYINSAGQTSSMTESVAPYSYFQKTMANVTDIVTIDIGGGTTDIVVAGTEGVKCVTSMRFAADAIFGNTLVAVQNGPLNGIVRQFKDIFLEKLGAVDQLLKMLVNMTANDCGNSSEVASFFFSLSENQEVRENNLQGEVDFNKMLMMDNSQKVVFYIFYTAIMYHLANLMKARNLEVPKNIAFSGNGSKVVSVLSPDAAILSRLTTKIFEIIYDTDIKSINLIINSQNPKEATCKGGLLLSGDPVGVEEARAVLLGTDSSTVVTTERYMDVIPKYDETVKTVMKFMDFITLRLPKAGISLKNDFGINKDSLDLAVGCFNKDLKTYIAKGVNQKLTSEVTREDVVEETLFFYPIIGVINDLSGLICRAQRG